MTHFGRHLGWMAPLILLLGSGAFLFCGVRTGGLAPEAAGIDAGVTSGLLGVAVGASAWAGNPVRRGVIQTLIAVAVAAAIGIIGWMADVYLLNHWLGARGAHPWEWVQRTEWARAAVFVAGSVGAALFYPLARRVEEGERRLRHQGDAAALHREAELWKLRQQLQPHFLYNSLNSISALIATSPEKAQTMIGLLSDFLRGSVRREADAWVPVADELQHIQTYLDIEAVRFGDRLQVQVAHSGVDGATMPPFLLQPLLENAVKYGVYGTTGPVCISLRLYREGRMLHVILTNPYDPHGAPAAGTGFGLEGLHRRLLLLFGRTDLLHTGALAGTFTATLRIPQRTA